MCFMETQIYKSQLGFDVTTLNKKKPCRRQRGRSLIHGGVKVGVARGLIHVDVNLSGRGIVCVGVKIGVATYVWAWPNTCRSIK